MTLRDAGCGMRVKAAPVVANGESQPRSVSASGYPDFRRLAVTDRVQRQFADDAQDRMGRVVGDARTRQVKPQGNVHACDMGGKRLPDRLVHRPLLQRVVSEVPEAVAEFVSA